MIQQPPYATQLLTHLYLNHHQHRILPRRPRVNRIMKMVICYPCDTRPHSHHITAHWIHNMIAVIMVRADLVELIRIYTMYLLR